jgi:hypothetical protein
MHFCIGSVEHGGELYAGEQEAIVEPSVWEPIQEELRARRSAGRKAYQSQKALLNGLLFCHLCDRPMAHTYAAAHGRCGLSHPSRRISRSLSKGDLCIPKILRPNVGSRLYPI